MRSNPGVSAKFFRALAEAGVNVEMISTSEIRISVVCRAEELDTAVRAVHDAFALGSETAEAVVDYRTQRLSCPHSVIYTEKDMVLIAQTMQLDMNQEEYILEGDVQLGHERDSLQAGKVIYNAKTQQYRLEQPGVITLYP